MVASLCEIGVNEIAEYRQDCTDQHGWKTADPREQIAAERNPDHRHENTEDFGRERHLVLRIMKKIEVEWESEARPDIVAERIGQDQTHDDEDAPAEAARKLAKRRYQRHI